MNNKLQIKRLVGISTLCAIAFVLQYWISGMLPKLPLGGGTAINLALIPVVVGAILYGPKGGLTVGLFLGGVTLLPGQGAEGFYVNWYMTLLAIVLCLAKTGVAGLVAGLVFKLLSKKKFTVGVLSAGLVTPVVNTGIFILLYGVLIQIMTGTAYGVTFVAVLGAVAWAFIIEVIINILMGPGICTLIKVLTRNYNLGFTNDFSNIHEELEEDIDYDSIG